MVNLKLKIGTKIGLVMVLIILLSVSMAFVGRNIIKKFQVASNQHIPNLTFYQEFLLGAKAELSKFANVNLYADTFFFDKEYIDMDVVLLFHWIKEMKRTFHENDEVNLDYKIVEQQATNFVNKIYNTYDLIREQSIIRRSNLRTMNLIYSLNY